MLAVFIENLPALQCCSCGVLLLRCTAVPELLEWASPEVALQINLMA